MRRIDRDGALPIGAALLVFGVAFTVFALSPVITNYDSLPAFPTAVSIVNRRTLSLDAYAHVHALATFYGVGRGGVRHGTSGPLLTLFPWGVALFAVPAVVFLDIAHLFGGPSADAVVAANGHVERLAQLWSGSLVTALSCAALAVLAYRRLHGAPATRRRLAVGCALVFAFGTSAWSTLSRALWEQGPSLLMLALGLVALDRLFPAEGRGEPRSARGAALVAGAALMAAVAVRPTDGIALVAAGGLLLWRRRRELPALISGVLVVAVPWLAVTYFYYGSLLQGYDSAGRLSLRSTFPEALATNLVSPARGLLVFSPVVLVAGAGLVVAWRRRRLGSLEVMSCAAAPTYLVGTSLTREWYAGASYGPRFMVETLPFLFVLSLPFVDWLRGWHAAKPASRRRAYRVAVPVLAVLVLVSVALNGEGAVVFASACWNGSSQSFKSIERQPSRVWSWSDPQFDYGYRALATDGSEALYACPARL